MNSTPNAWGGRLACTLLAVTIFQVPGGLGAQTSAEAPGSAPRTLKTLYLKNVTQEHDANEIMVALRNMLDPRDKVILVGAQNAVIVEGSPEQLALAQQIISDLDRPKKSYRLTYTLTEMDGGKRVGVHHVSMVVAAGQRTVMKQGSKVPVITGSYDSGKAAVESQATYLDVGINLDATLDELASGLKLKTKVEQSSVDAQRSTVGPQDPIIRQSVLEGTSSLVSGKPLVLGSMDLPDSTQQLQIEVVAEPIS